MQSPSADATGGAGLAGAEKPSRTGVCDEAPGVGVWAGASRRRGQGLGLVLVPTQPVGGFVGLRPSGHGLATSPEEALPAKGGFSAGL